ncbi:CLUMA_CG011285, isoform A [Clunio marinus]|uniref:CLUMA_CG011285, isoform A n=1 Tax=Clunio marinus TaxID=568069 RepID=A0A1J1IFU9_9DIPT|nr:CLUMA_CG011285, isoform A [Clunio marinus]
MKARHPSISFVRLHCVCFNGSSCEKGEKKFAETDGRLDNFKANEKLGNQKLMSYYARHERQSDFENQN